MVDPAPVGVPVSYTTRENVPLTVPAAQGVLAGDTDSAGDPLTATLANDGRARHVDAEQPTARSPTRRRPGFTGTVSFTYVPHGTYSGGTATTVTITVGQARRPRRRRHRPAGASWARRRPPCRTRPAPGRQGQLPASRAPAIAPITPITPIAPITPVVAQAIAAVRQPR